MIGAQVEDRDQLSSAGTVASIGHELDGRGYGHYQDYNNEGNPTRSWDYDENGKQINMHIPR